MADDTTTTETREAHGGLTETLLYYYNYYYYYCPRNKNLIRLPPFPGDWLQRHTAWWWEAFVEAPLPQEDR